MYEFILAVHNILRWIVLILLAMYFARKPFHRSMASMGQILYNAMRLAASSVKLAEKRLQIRNREVLLAEGMEQAERRTERRKSTNPAAANRMNMAVRKPGSIMPASCNRSFTHAPAATHTERISRVAGVGARHERNPGASFAALSPAPRPPSPEFLL